MSKFYICDSQSVKSNSDKVSNIGNVPVYTFDIIWQPNRALNFVHLVRTLFCHKQVESTNPCQTGS